MIAAGLLLNMAVTVALPNASWADQTIRNLKRPVAVQLETPVQNATATVGQAFAAKTTEPVHYKNYTLPAGTEFKGHITKLAHSKHFGRPGYAILQTDSATLPSGQTLNFDSAQYKPRNRALHHPDTETFLQSVAIQLPYTLVSMGVTLPLYYVFDVDWRPLLLVGEGVRIAAGGLFGLVRPKFRKEPVPRKIALGMLDGSGIPRVVNFIGTYPEPDYHQGDQIKLYLPPQGLNDLMQASKTATLPRSSDLSSANSTGAEFSGTQSFSRAQPLPAQK